MKQELNFAKEYFLNLPAAAVDMEKAANIVLKALQNSDKPFFIASVNPEICVAARKNKELADAVSGCSLGIPDGVGIILASKIKGGRITSRVTGIDFMDRICSLAEINGYSIFLLGASPGVAEEASLKLKEKYRRIRIAGTHNGYFKKEEETKIAQIICESQADILFVGLGSPRQELFISRNAGYTGAKILMTVGGSFDVISGNLKRAPRIYQKFGIEWMYRVIIQPSRFSRLFKLPLFLFLVLSERISQFIRRNGNQKKN